MSTSHSQDKFDVSDGEVVINPTTYSRSNARNVAVVMDLIEHLLTANAIHVVSCCILPMYPDQKKAYVDAMLNLSRNRHYLGLSVAELGLVFGDFQATAGPDTDVRDVVLHFLPRLNVLAVSVLKTFWTVLLEKYLVNGGAAD
ncbi:hypothetical protein CNMCM7691_002042 [Aspergillus felis]|uniref:Uncharacterized protein n=1 Tax=Aspergillus felis TaxID=1287682 RepID=A0A8H6V9E5_9EURO|nr:hypothetical protein CNMCM7691_002042 [Aspergillus felis]